MQSRQNQIEVLCELAGILSVLLWGVFGLWALGAVLGRFIFSGGFDATFGKWAQTFQSLILLIVLVGVLLFVNRRRAKAFSMVVLAVVGCLMLSVSSAAYLWLWRGLFPDFWLFLVPALQYLFFGIGVRFWLGEKGSSNA